MKTHIVANSLSKLTGLFSRAPYRTGVALSGGGARGFAHIGVLQAMDEKGIRPDVVAGVSAGAVAAVFYAAGIPFEKMVRAFEGLKFNDLAELGVPKDGFFKLDRFAKFLNANIPYKRIEDLPVKTLICATDIDHGESVVFEEGPLAECVIASCSIPIVFKPRVINGVKYVDGGVLHNLPAWAIRQRCRQLIGVNVSPIDKTARVKGTIIDMAVASFKLMSKNNATPDMALCDHVISVDDIAKVNVFNITEVRKIYRLGYRTALKSLEEL